MRFVFFCNISTVFENCPAGWHIIFQHTQIDLVFRNNGFCKLQAQSQSFCTISPTAKFPFDTVSDVTCSCPQNIRQMMSDPIFTNERFAVPKIIIGFGHKPVGHIDRMLMLHKLRKNMIAVFLKRYAIVRIRQPVFVRRQRRDVPPLFHDIIIIHFSQRKHTFDTSGPFA